jgi:hypothetical protein
MRNEIDRAWSGHPSEEWTAMDQWRKDVEEFEAKMADRKPWRDDYDDEEKYKKALAEWEMALHCDRPNKPGYFRANND